jgi:hypothetical protein
MFDELPPVVSKADLEVAVLAFHLVEIVLQDDVVLALICKHEGHLHTSQVDELAAVHTPWR